MPSTWPPSVSITAGPAPLNGTWTMRAPLAELLNNSITRCGKPPVPDDANVTCLFPASAISSFRLVAGTLGLTASTSGAIPIRVMPTRSFCASYGRTVSLVCGNISTVVAVVTNSV